MEELILFPFCTVGPGAAGKGELTKGTRSLRHPQSPQGGGVPGTYRGLHLSFFIR